MKQPELHSDAVSFHCIIIPFIKGVLRIKIDGNSSLKKDWVDQREHPISDQKEKEKC